MCNNLYVKNYHIRGDLINETIKKIKKNLLKSLFLLFVSIFIATCNYNIASATTYLSINSNGSYRNIIEPYESTGGYSISDVDLVRTQNGNFEGSIPIYDERGIGVATVEFKLLQDLTIRNMYTVVYDLTSTELVNGIRWNIAVTESSFQVCFLSGGWKSGASFNGTYKVN